MPRKVCSPKKQEQVGNVPPHRASRRNAKPAPSARLMEGFGPPDKKSDNREGF